MYAHLWEQIQLVNILWLKYCVHSFKKKGNLFLQLASNAVCVYQEKIWNY